METYLYKSTTKQNHDNLILLLTNMGLSYNLLVVNAETNWFIIDCTNENARLLKEKGFNVSLDGLILKTC